MKKKDGFVGQEAIVLPQKVIQQCQAHPLIHDLHLTDIGYYPKAKFHFRERKIGIEQHILIYCVDGKGWARLDNKLFELRPSHFLILPKATAHSYWADEQQPWTIYWLHFKGEKAEEISRLLYENFLNANNQSDPGSNFLAVFTNIYRQLQNGYSLDNLLFCNLNLYTFFSALLFPSKTQTPKSDQEPGVADKAIHFIKQNIEKKITLEELSAAVYLSASQFSNVFRKSTGFTPIEYVNHLKIQRACQLLQFEQLRIREIAAQIGFDDPYYFSRLFTTVMGVSPKKYRLRKSMDLLQGR